MKSMQNAKSILNHSLSGGIPVLRIIDGCLPVCPEEEQALYHSNPEIC
jgi:hypothetical protein